MLYGNGKVFGFSVAGKHLKFTRRLLTDWGGGGNNEPDVHLYSTLDGRRGEKNRYHYWAWRSLLLGVVKVDI